MKTGRKIMILILLFIGGVLSGSIFYEWYGYQSEYKDLEVFINLAGKAALQQQQDLYLMWDQSESLSSAVNAAQRHSVISDTARAEIQAAIDTERISKTHVVQYANQLEYLAETGERLTRYDPTQNNAKPYSTDTDLFYYLDYIRQKAIRDDEDYNPIQFGLSYIDEVMLDILFRDNLRRLIEVNYNNPANNSNSFMYEKMDFRSSSVKVTGPNLVKIASDSQQEKDVFAQLFGRNWSTERVKDLSYKSRGVEHATLVADAFADYVISYKITFTASGWHNTRSPIGQRNGVIGSVFGLAEGSGWRWKTVTQPSGVAQQYVSIGLPSMTYDTNYILTN